jgi:threonine aldolase
VADAPPRAAFSAPAGLLGVGPADVEAKAIAGCVRFLQLHGRRPPSELLADIPADVAVDRYGHGGVVAELEEETARVLGKPAAVFLPSGTMAQQATLRVHADRRGRAVFVSHPACHLEWGEGRAYERLHHLSWRPAGDIRLPLTAAQLEAVAEAPAALLLELPQRTLGGDLPDWDDLLAQVEWARGRGAAVHLDGARLWECGPHYGRSPAEIAALFDTVYVSFYKGLGALSGCCLAGSSADVAEVREWRLRHGGTLFSLWPYAASALTCLRRRLPKMAAYHDHAVAIAAALSGLPGVEVLPDPPHTPMMHLLVRATASQLGAAVVALAEQRQVWTFSRWFASDSPATQRVELAVGDATMGFTPTEVRDVMAFLVGWAS